MKHDLVSPICLVLAKTEIFKDNECGMVTCGAQEKYPLKKDIENKAA